MKTMLRKLMLLPLLLLAFGAVSCTDDEELEEELVGRWRYYYEEPGLFEEEILSFNSWGTWESTYRRVNAFNPFHSTYENDWGTYEVILGKLVLYSDRHSDIHKYDLEFRHGRLYLDDTEYERVR
jgi:hypothetical protein